MVAKQSTYGTSWQQDANQYILFFHRIETAAAANIKGFDDHASLDNTILSSDKAKKIWTVNSLLMPPTETKEADTACVTASCLLFASNLV